MAGTRQPPQEHPPRRLPELALVDEAQAYATAELADRLALDRSYLPDIERGKQNVSLLNLEIIARWFKVTLSRLLSGL